MIKCSVEDCQNEAFAKTWCRVHYDRMRANGSLEPVRVSLTGKICSVEGCGKSVKGNGLCGNHYYRLKKYGRLEKLEKKKTNKTLHPFYHLWFERKQNNDLVEEWLDFWKFANNIGEKPDGHFFLSKKTIGLYGPNNFEWKEKLKQQDDETNKEWWARKWEDRRIRNPEEEYGRNLFRNFGMSLEEYNLKWQIQNGNCAICKKEESVKRGSRISRLSVDHCHTSNKIRDLLCNRCNTVLGNVEEDIGLLQAMVDYLNKHKEVENGSSP